MSRTGPVLEAVDIAKSFGSNMALRGVSFELRQGELLGIIGPNGCGKSTLINCLSGVLHPTSGRVQYAGADISRWSVSRRARAGLVRTYQNLGLFRNMTVLENVMARHAVQGDAPMRVLEELDLMSVRHKIVQDLSYGHQRRTELARVLVVTPEVLLLDEPAAGLDTSERERLARVLTSRLKCGMTIALIDHDMALISAVCSRVLVLDAGQVIFDGTPQAALADPRVIKVYLGTPLEEAS